MRKAVALGVILASPALAESPRAALFPGDGVCYRRDYDAAHLAAHPDQWAFLSQIPIFPRHFALPRGCAEEARKLLGRHGIGLSIRDERCGGSPLDVPFRGNLRPEQHVAASAMEQHDFGVLAATTVFGKIFLAAWLIAKRGLNTLALVHRRQLLEQWVERLSKFLGLPEKSIGRLGDRHHPIIFFQCGPVRHRVNAKKQAAGRPFAQQSRPGGKPASV